jgi:hypothetical protein
MTTVKKALRDLADVIRSKNAGPYELTLDIIFKTQEIFEQVVASKAITPEKIAALYSMPPEKVVSFVEFAPAKAIKITLERPLVCGDVGDNDIYGAQQHAPLLMLEVPLPAGSA